MTVLATMSALVCWIGGAYSWLMAYRNRAPDVPFNGFSKDSFTHVGLSYRRHFSIFWLASAASMLLIFLLNRG